MTISAFLPVFNEEKRIKDTLVSLMWCDEIILVDKSSTDNTVEIALSFGDKIKVCSMNNSEVYDSSEWNVFLKNCTSEWTILFTASDVIHPKLTKKIRDKISDINFDYDIIHIPFKRYVLGIDSKRSPWHSKLNPVVVRKSAFVIDNNEVHYAAKKVGKEYKFEDDSNECMYHLTHESVDVMMDRHLRYWRGEANSSHIDLKKSELTVFKEFIRVVFYKKTFLLGKDGIMLSFAYLTYFMMSYVYQWEKKQGNGPNKYSEIKDNISTEWKRHLNI